MKSIITTFITVFILSAAYCQPILVNGFNGMAAVDGSAYSKIRQTGDTTGGYPFVCASNDRMKFFSSSFSKGYLYFIDPSTFNVVDSMSDTLYHLSASNEPNTLFARTNTGICRINTLSKTVTDNITIPNPFYVLERPNAKEVWVTGDNKIYVVDYSSGLVATSITVSANTSDLGEIKFTPGGSTAYRVAWATNKVYKINADTKTILDSAMFGTSSPEALVVTRDSSKIWVAFPSDKKIRIYQTATMTLIDSIDCGTREPFEIYRHPDRQEIWVVNHFKDSITVFNENTKAQIAAFNVSSSPHSLAFGIGSTTTKAIQSGETKIAVYPNPVSDGLTISGVEAGNIVTVYTIDGRQVLSLKATDKQQTFNVADLKTGNYILQVTDSHGTIKTNTPIVKR